MRFTTFFLVTLMLLTANTVLAREKTPDVMNASATALVTASFNPPVLGALTAQSGTYDRIYNQGAVDVQCGAEAIDSANDGTYYDLFCLQVDDEDPIELILDAAGTNITDTVLTLYCAPFDPLHPEQNVLAFDDDSGESTLSAFTLAQNIVLTPGEEYWLVVSTYGAGMTGNYVIQRSGNVYDCGIVGDEETNWGSVKGLFR